MQTKNVKVAVAQISPEFMNTPATIAKVVSTINEAGNRGVQLLLFPEALVPGYPRGMNFGVVVGHRDPSGRKAFQDYWEQAVCVPGPQLDLVGKAAKDMGIHVVLGVIEKDPHRCGGTLYCTTVYFGANGQYLGKHRKIKPTAAERYIWGEGDGSSVKTYQTPIGKLGGLICWENYMPLARTMLYQQGVELYLAPTADARPAWQASMRHIALEGRCFVLSCNQVMRWKDYPAHWQARIGQKETALCKGGSVIISPLGEVLAGPLWDEEGLLTADIHLGDLAAARFDFDCNGHYARPDLFECRIKS